MGRFRKRSQITPEIERGERWRPKTVMRAVIAPVLLASIIAPATHADEPEDGDFRLEAPIQAESTSQIEASVFPPLESGSITSFFLEPGATSVVNLTMTETVGAGYVQALPGEIGKASNVNSSELNQTIANLAFVTPEGPYGSAGIFNQIGTHVIADVNGTLRSGSYEAVTPTRLFDSRIGSPEPIAQGSVVRIGGLRPNSTAVLTLTTTETVTNGYVQILDPMQPNQAPGGYSNANAEIGRNIANLAIVRVNANGDVFAFVQGSTELIADVSGYFVEGVTQNNQRLLDTRNERSQPIPAGSIIEVKGGPKNATAITRVTSVGATQQGFIQALPVENPVPGSTSNLNMDPGRVIGQMVFLEFDDNGVARIFVQNPTHILVDMMGVLDSGVYTSASERVVDTRDNVINRPKLPVCEKVALAVGTTAAGAADLQYEIKIIDSNGRVNSYPAPDLSLFNAANHFAIDPVTCDKPGGPVVYYSQGEYPDAEVFRRDLLERSASKVATPPGKYERPEPQAEGLLALQTDNGRGQRYIGYVTNLATGQEVYSGSAIDFSESDNGETVAYFQNIFRGYFGGDNTFNDSIVVIRQNPSTKRQELRTQYVPSPDINNRIIGIEVSPDGETVVVLRNNGSPIPEISVVSDGAGYGLDLQRVPLPSTLQPTSVKLINENTAIVTVIDNGSGSQTLRTLSVNLPNGSFSEIDMQSNGRIADLSM